MRENEVIEQIPPPETVRERLGRALRETALLRRLLRLSELKRRQDATDKAAEADTRQEASR